MGPQVLLVSLEIRTAKYSQRAPMLIVSRSLLQGTRNNTSTATVR